MRDQLKIIFRVAFTVFSLVYFCTSHATASSSLQLNQVLSSISKHYPKLKQQQQYYQKAKAKNMAANSFFDPTLVGQVGTQTGYYDNSSANIALEQTLPVLGAKVSAGWRVSDGIFAVYDEILNTTDDGEVYAALKVPLLKGGLIDEKRTKIKVSKIEIERANLVMKFNHVLYQYEGALAYWKWVASGLKLKTYQHLLEVASKRQRIIQAKVQAGSEPEIDLADNQQFVANRQALLFSAQQELNESALKLSLYYRDANGNPIIISEDKLPNTFQLQVWWPADQRAEKNYDLERHLGNHPLLKYYALKLEQNQQKLQLAKTNMLPEVNFGLKVANDLGNGATKNINTEELKTSVSVSFPLLNRQARGEMNQAKIDQSILQLEYRLNTDKVRMTLQNALQKIKLARERVSLTEEQWRLSRKLENAERLKFDSGTSSLLYVNLREEYAIKARIAYIEAMLDHHSSIAEFHLAAATPLENEFN